MRFKYTLSFILMCCFIASHGQEFLSLEQCRQLSLDYNRQLKSEQFKVQIAQFNTQAAKKNRFVNLDATSSFVYNAQKITNEGATVNDRYLYRTGLNANQLIYGGGRVQSSIQLNKIMEEQGQAFVSLSELEVISQADIVYWNAVSFNEYIAYWQRYLDYLNEFIKVVNERVESGLVGQNDLLTAKLKYNEGEIALANAKANHKRAISQLCNLIGKPANTNLTVEDSLNYMGILPDSSQVYQSALEARPEIYISEFQNKSIGIQRELIKAQYRINLNAGITFNYGNKINENNDATNVIGLATLGIPITRWGKKQNELSANNYESLIAQENMKALKESIQLEIHMAFVSLEEAITQIKIANNAKENARENLKIANNKYKEGLSSIIEVTDAQTILQNAVISYIQSKANYYYSLTAYNRAVVRY